MPVYLIIFMLLKVILDISILVVNQSDFIFVDSLFKIGNIWLIIKFPNAQLYQGFTYMNSSIFHCDVITYVGLVNII